MNENHLLSHGHVGAGFKPAPTFACLLLCLCSTVGAAQEFPAIGTKPGATVTFAEFRPSPCAATGTVWHLTDARESENPQTYKVRKMQDGRIWMVQDLKFGDKCDKETFKGSNGSDQRSSKLTGISGYIYGDCRNNTQPGAGYLYDWAGALQKAGAFYGSWINVGCSGTSPGTGGTNPGACRGICPSGWHIPTGNSDGEFNDLHHAAGRGCSIDNDDCWDANSYWEGVYGGYSYSDGALSAQGSYALYWSSTYYSSAYAYNLTFDSSAAFPDTDNNSKRDGLSVRCVMNY
jgi:uncharacterized protein (TIGR02145 family)